MRKKRQHELIMTSSEHITEEQQLRTPQRMRRSTLATSTSTTTTNNNNNKSMEGQSSLSVPPSPCATSTTSSPATTRSLDCSLGSHSTTIQGSNNITWRYLKSTAAVSNSSNSSRVGGVLGGGGGGSKKNYNRVLPVPPSPSRSVLDPDYASRLYQYHPRQDLMIDTQQMPPPSGIQRGMSTRSSSTGMPSTPVHSVGSEVDVDVVNTSVMSTSTQYFTPERPERSHFTFSPSLQSPSRSYQTPRSSPRGKTSFYSANVTPSKYGGLSSSTTPKARGDGERQLYSDRFIPSRASSNLTFSVWDDAASNNNLTDDNRMSSPSNTQGADGFGDVDGSGSRQDGYMNNSQSQSQQQPILNALLRSELLGENLEPSLSSSSNNANNTMSPQRNNGRRTSPAQESRPPLTDGRNFLRYNQARRQLFHDEVFRHNSSTNPTSVIDSFSLSPVGVKSSHRLMNMPQKRKRKIAKVPFKVLDAPSLADDFYLNLVDWSSLNVLAVGLGSCVYLWSACTSKVTKLCDLGVSSQDSITSVAWTQKGTHLAVGVNNGEVQIWDAVKCKKIRKMDGHSARIGALSWSGATLASGSRDRLIYLRDVRIQQPFTARLGAHKQEVCGLKWSFDEPAHLASGGNDNKLLVWDIKMHRQPKHRFAEHTAAVKAIAWSPHQHGLLASGGGTADRCIRFWNALSGTSLNAIDTGSQVCNLAWSKNCNEIVSTHGYSLNQIAIWKYPTMQKVATLTGHTYRVLYLAMSPDGSTIVT